MSESVRQIMAREARAPRKPFRTRQAGPRLVRRNKNAPQNPSSPPASHWPLRATQTPLLTSSPSTPLAATVAGSSFLGAQLSDTAGYVPPDSMADVGPAQILVCVNGRIRTFTRGGVADGVLDATTDNFFASVLGAGLGTTDPRVRYDRLSGRWFISMITVNTPNSVLIAVSSGSIITSSSAFAFFSFPADPVNFGDYDTLGVDASALYLGVNVFSGNTYLNSTAFVVNKADLLQGTLTVSTFTNLITASGGAQHGPYTPQGVNNDDPAATNGYFIGVDETSGTLALRRVFTPGGVPSLSGNILLTVPLTSLPMGGVPALGSSEPLDDGDDRLLSARMHQGALWTEQTIDVDAKGVASPSGGRDATRWYEITNLDSTPGLAQSGTLFDSSTSHPRNFWTGSCAVSGQGRMALGCSVADAAEYADVAVAQRLAADPAGFTRAPATAVASSSGYNRGDQGGIYRWGDFSETTTDPADDMTLWTIQEFCNASNSWGVQVIKLPAPAPALPTACAPASVTAGAGSVRVTVSGAATNGAGFFDPGPGYPNHISATVNGGGVTVESVQYNNPTNLTVVLTVTNTAVGGSRMITIQNPDGQSATSASGLLTVIAATNHAPELAPIADRSLHALQTLTLTNSASDPDAGQTLAFSLGAGAPAGASIGAASGVLTWTPAESQIGTNAFTVIVTDNGSPPLSATQSFTVSVLPLPSVTVGVSNGLFALAWNAISGTTYQVQWKTNLGQGAWLPLTNVVANGPSAAAADVAGAAGPRFYRVQIVQ